MSALATRHTSLLVAALLAAAACRDSTGPGEAGSLEDALEQVTKTGETLALPGVTMMGGMPAPIVSGAATPCAYNAATRSFDCPTVDVSDVSVTRSYQLLDASGTPQAAWGPAVVAIRNTSDMEGTLSPVAGMTLQVTSHDESTLSGLQSNTQALTGTSTSTMIMTSGGETLTSHVTRSTNLTFTRSSAAMSYPSGTITMATTTEGTYASSHSMTMTFDGTSRVRMAMSLGGGITITCTYDMATPGAAPACG